jgi:DNA-directed RNA polymerase specialized sigma24 family protein
LLTPLAADNSASFDELYRREHRSLLRLAWTLTGRRNLGEELVQETLLSVHRRWAVVREYDAPVPTPAGCC